jgi:cysteine synthase
LNLFGRQVSDEEAVQLVQTSVDDWAVKHGSSTGSTMAGATRAAQAGVEKVAAEKLLQRALTLGSPDNITVIVILLPWE